MERTGEEVVVLLEGQRLAATSRALRVLETSHPPTYYIPFADIDMTMLAPAAGSSWCEFKGRARYWEARSAGSVGWSYPEPARGFEALREHLAFYPSKAEARVDGEQVRAQEGDFYGGWITSRVVGPFKGGPGTQGW